MLRSELVFEFLVDQIDVLLIRPRRIVLGNACLGGIDFWHALSYDLVVDLLLPLESAHLYALVQFHDSFLDEVARLGLQALILGEIIVLEKSHLKLFIQEKRVDLIGLLA